MPTSTNATVNDKYVSKYVGLGYRAPSPEEIAIRRTARNLKIPTDDAIQQAAPEMAALIDGPCWLVPVPRSDGSITANLALANAIAVLVTGARVRCAVGRIRPVESSYQRRMRGLPGLTIEQHAIIRTAGPLQLLPVYFVDNVVTTGTTVAACRRALGWGTGLTYADASTRGILASAYKSTLKGRGARNRRLYSSPPAADLIMENPNQWFSRELGYFAAC